MSYFQNSLTSHELDLVVRIRKCLLQMEGGEKVASVPVLSLRTMHFGKLPAPISTTCNHVIGKVSAD